MPQEAFDLNGDWDGVTTDGSDTFVQFTIKNNVLVTASCEGQGKATVALSGAVSNGEFSVGGPDAFLLSGRSVTASVAIRKIMAPACYISNSPWHAFSYVIVQWDHTEVRCRLPIGICTAFSTGRAPNRLLLHIRSNRCSAMPTSNRRGT